MSQIPNNFGEGGRILTTKPLTDGTPTLKDVVNGLATDVAAMQGDAPETITSPLSAALTAIPSPLDASIGAITAPLTIGVPALTAAAPADISTAALADVTSLRNYVVALRSEVIAARADLSALRTELTNAHAFANALRTEVVALRDAQTTRAGVTLAITPSADYT